MISWLARATKVKLFTVAEGVRYWLPVDNHTVPIGAQMYFSFLDPNFPLISLLLRHCQVTIENLMLNFRVGPYQAKKREKPALEKGQLLPDQN